MDYGTRDSKSIGKTGPLGAKVPPWKIQSPSHVYEIMCIFYPDQYPRSKPKILFNNTHMKYYIIINYQCIIMGMYHVHDTVFFLN